MRQVQEYRWHLRWRSYITPEHLDAVIGKLTIATNTLFDAIWQFQIGGEPEALARLRRRQKLVLAVRGRQSLLQWDNVEVNEISEWADELVDLLAGGVADPLDEVE